jgi:hypothetical protein
VKAPVRVKTDAPTRRRGLGQLIAFVAAVQVGRLASVAFV